MNLFKDKYQKRFMMRNFIIILMAIIIITSSWFAGNILTHTIISPFLNVITKDLYTRSNERIYRIDQETLPVRTYDLKLFAIDQEHIDLISICISVGFVMVGMAISFLLMFYKKNDLNTIMYNMTDEERIAFMTKAGEQNGKTWKNRNG